MEPLEITADAEQAISSLLGSHRSGNDVDLTTRVVKCSKHGSVEEKALGRALMCQDIRKFCDLDELDGPLHRIELAKEASWGTTSRHPGFFTDSVKDDSLYK